MQKMLGWLCATLLLPLLVAARVPAADDAVSIKDAAKAVLSKYQDAIVTVKLVTKTGNVEHPSEIAGTVLTPEGLTVVSDSNSNPFQAFGDEEGGRSQTTDVKIVLKDGKELPAKFVLRDRDLDLAFVLPTEKGLKLTHVQLEKAPVPQPLDELIFVRRLDKSLNREVSVRLARVEAVVKKPRTFLVPDLDLITAIQNLGGPVFDARGRAIGIVVVRRGAGGPRGGNPLARSSAVILTTEDVQGAANQAAKPAEEGK
jgi:hypothetical protein